MPRKLLIACFLCALCLGQTTFELLKKPISLLDALQATLQKNPAVHVQERQIEFQQGVLDVASGQFDTTLNAGGQQERVNTPLTLAEQVTYKQAGVKTSDIASNLTDFSFSSQSFFRNGITAGPVLSLNRTTDNVVSRVGLNQSKLAYEVILPMLRGRGREVVTAQETSARESLEASVYDLNYTISQLLANTAIQYWNAVGAARNLEIAKDAEERGRNYVRDVQTLIDADRVARGEINQLLANLADRVSSRVAAEQSLMAAQQNLALAMGLGAAEMAVFEDPSDPLPDWNRESLPPLSTGTIQKFLDEALQRRPDLLASNRRTQSAQVLVPAAKNQLLPQVNVTLSAGYSGLLEDTNVGRSLGSFFSNVKGLDATASVTYMFQPRNNVARGVLAQTEASYQQAILRQSDLARNIASNVVTAMTGLVTAIARLRESRNSVKAYQLALTGEQEKFRLGLGSLVDVLTIEDRLTGELGQELSAQVDFAVGIETLRFATGTIVEPDAKAQSLDKSTFLSLPLDWGKPQL